jgi:hypothetical protein
MRAFGANAPLWYLEQHFLYLTPEPQGQSILGESFIFNEFQR